MEMTNLRLFLKDQKANESDKHWFGGRFRHDGGYNSGGSAYILSRSVLEQLVQVGLSKNICNSDVEGYEDQQMGICLNKLNITTGHTADEYGRLKFLPFKLETLLNPESDKQKYGWFKAFSLYPLKEVTVQQN